MHKGGGSQHVLAGLVAVGTQGSQGQDPLNQTGERSVRKGPHAATRPGPAAQSEQVSGHAPGQDQGGLGTPASLWVPALRTQDKPTAPVCSEPCPFS